MKKIVLKLDIFDDKIKKKAMKKISGISGIVSIMLDLKENKMIVFGEIDPVEAVVKLRRICDTDIISVETAKPEKKKEEEPKKQEPKKEEPPKEDEAVKLTRMYQQALQQLQQLQQAYQQQRQQLQQAYQQQLQQAYSYNNNNYY